MSEPAKNLEPKTEGKAEKKVKIKTLRAIQIDGNIIEAGKVIEVTEAQAAEFCDRKFAGYMPFYGNKPEGTAFLGDSGHDPLGTKQISRAERVR